MSQGKLYLQQMADFRKKFLYFQFKDEIVRRMKNRTLTKDNFIQLILCDIRRQQN